MMANNRYFLYCDCGKAKFLGKSLGDGIYNRGEKYFLEDVYRWMWEHLLHKEDGEWFSGEAFKVLTEYDDRINYKNNQLGE